MDLPTTEQAEAPIPDEQAINVALLVDGDYLYRFRSLFAHMLVGLVDQPITVTLVSPDPQVAQSLPVGPAKVVEFKVPFWPWRYGRALDDLADTLRTERVNLIHACSGRSCWLAVDLARKLDIPFLITFNGLFQEECFLRVDRRLCGRLIGISEPICATLRDLYGKKNHSIEMIRPGCFIRSRTTDVPRPNTIVSVGNLTHGSGYDVLLRAVLDIRDRGHELLTVIFGRGPLEHSYHRWVNKHGLGSQVTFLPVLSNWEDVLRDVDFYVQPGSFNSLHAGPYEALAHGCPILAADDSALDILADGRTGYTFQTGNPRALADRLEEWLAGRLNWQELSAQSYMFARSELSLARSIEKLSACYRAVLAGTHV